VKRDRLAGVVLVIAVVAFFFVEWARAREAAPIIDDWMRANVDGVQLAPEQYRVALPRLVSWMPLPPPLSVTLIETLSLGGTFALLFRLVQRSPHRTLAFFAALILPCVWLFSYERPETLPTCFYVVAMIALAGAPRWSIMLALGAFQSLVRADVPVVVGAALAASGAAPAIGVACMAEGLAAQLALSLVYAHAHYPNGVPVVQLFANVTRPTSIASFVIVAAPLVATFFLQRRKRVPLVTEDRVAIWAAALYAPLWFCVGSLREARIFAPMSFALVPTLTKIWSALVPTKSENGRTH
jgi:hypothetical protein